jgi:hypothetical protein
MLDYEELGGLSDLGLRDCAHGLHLIGKGVGHGPRPTLVVTTRSIVEILTQY